MPHPVDVAFRCLLVDGRAEQLGLGSYPDTVADFANSHLFQRSRVHVHQVLSSNVVSYMAISSDPKACLQRVCEAHEQRGRYIGRS